MALMASAPRAPTPMHATSALRCEPRKQGAKALLDVIRTASQHTDLRADMSAAVRPSQRQENDVQPVKLDVLARGAGTLRSYSKSLCSG